MSESGEPLLSDVDGQQTVPPQPTTPVQDAPRAAKVGVSNVLFCFAKYFLRLGRVVVLFVLAYATTLSAVFIAAFTLALFMHEDGRKPALYLALYSAMCILIASVALCLTWPFATALTLKAIGEAPSAWLCVWEHARELFKCSGLMLLRVSPVVIWLAMYVPVFVYRLQSARTDPDTKGDFPVLYLVGLVVTGLFGLAWCLAVWVQACLAPCLVVDKFCTARNAMQESKALIRDHRARTIFLQIVIPIIAVLIFWVVFFPLMVLLLVELKASAAWANITGRVAGMLLTLALIPLNYLVPAVMYQYLLANHDRASELAGIRQATVV